MRVKIYFVDREEFDTYHPVAEVKEEGSYTVLVRPDGEKDVMIQTALIRRIFTYDE